MQPGWPQGSDLAPGNVVVRISPTFEIQGGARMNCMWQRRVTCPRLSQRNASGSGGVGALEEEDDDYSRSGTAAAAALHRQQ
eukprot:gene8734-1401_t